jgi:hypothetical protein
MRTILVICLWSGLGGCFVYPPVRGGAGGGGGAGSVAIRNSAGEVRTHGVARVGQLRLALTPLVLTDFGKRRRGDFSLGWNVEWTSAGGSRHDLRHGPFMEAAWFMWRGAPSSAQSWRLAPTVLAEAVLGADTDDTDSGVRGYGAAAGVLYEFADYVRARALGGGVMGEMAIGLAARVGVRHVDGGTHAYGIVSIEFRLPGIAALPIPVPKHRTALVQ